MFWDLWKARSYVDCTIDTVCKKTVRKKLLLYFHGPQINVSRNIPMQRDKRDLWALAVLGPNSTENTRLSVSLTPLSLFISSAVSIPLVLKKPNQPKPKTKTHPPTLQLMNHIQTEKEFRICVFVQDITQSLCTHFRTSSTFNKRSKNSRKLTGQNKCFYFSFLLVNTIEGSYVPMIKCYNVNRWSRYTKVNGPRESPNSKTFLTLCRVSNYFTPAYIG